MSKEKLGQDCAFPADARTMTDGGMSKRFYAACAAMQGLLANSCVMQEVVDRNVSDLETIAKGAFEYADALLREENK